MSYLLKSKDCWESSFFWIICSCSTSTLILEPKSSYNNTPEPIVDSVPILSVQETLNKAGIKNGTYITGLNVDTDIKIIKDKILDANPKANVTLTNSSNKAKDTGKICTGDKVTITSGSETKTYEIVLYGDTNGDGMNLLRELKLQHKKSAVIILSAKDSVDDKVEGLLVGADDYLAKPFHFSELLARIKVSLRKNQQQGEQLISYKNIVLNPDDRRVFINEIEVNLNRKEYDLFYYFMLRPERVFQKTTLAENVWGDHIEMADNLDFIYSQIKNLRKKLKEANAEADLQAVYGVGYKLI